VSRKNDAFNSEYFRINTLYKALNQLRNIYGDIKQKISIWSSNDQMYQVSNIIGETPLILNYIARWPLIVHLATGCFCLGASAIFHLFEHCSTRSYDLLSKLDYTGISILIMGSSYPPIFYCFACQPVFWVRNIFLIAITVSATLTFVITMHPVANKPHFRPYRAAMFVALGISAAFPFIYLSNAPDD